LRQGEFAKCTEACTSDAPAWGKGAALFVPHSHSWVSEKDYQISHENVKTYPY